MKNIYLFFILFLLNKEGHSEKIADSSLSKERLPFLLIIAFDIVYGIICFMGVFGNMLVLYIVFRKPHMRTITNIFIANLSVSDILMSVVAGPFTSLFMIHDSFILYKSSLYCALIPVTMGVSVYVSTFSCMATAIDRYFVIIHPFVPRMRYGLCTIIILIIWIMAMLISIPLGIYQELGFDEEKNESYCMDSWPDYSFSIEMFTIMVFILQFFLPTVIISYCYFSIARVLKKRHINKIGIKTKSRLREERDIERNRRTNRMLISMIAIFVVCWIPLNAFWMVVDFMGSRDKTKHNPMKLEFMLFFVPSHQLAMSSAIYNPFLYAWMNENFRHEFKNLLPCSFSTRNRNNSLAIVNTESTAYPMSTNQECLPINHIIIHENQKTDEILDQNLAKTEAITYLSVPNSSSD